MSPIRGGPVSDPEVRPPQPFDEAFAERYDQQFAAISAVKDALSLLLATALSHLPADARVLLVGAGTGAEARLLAPLHPGWRFTLVDPAAPMLAVARRHAEACGFADRCTFHVGFASELPLEPHDAATAVLVSHFITEAAARRAFFGDIAARLAPGGTLFNADLAPDRASPGFDGVLELWLRLMERTGQPEVRTRWLAGFGKAFAVHGPAEVEAFIADAGFSPPSPCYQAALIRCWTATRLPA